MIKLEALADSICQLNDTASPESEAYKLRNPGLLRSFSLERPQPTTTEGLRIFSSFVGGYQALLKDLEIKCLGRSRAYAINKTKLQPTSTLRDLLHAYGWRDDQPIEMAISFLRSALQDRQITAATRLEYFTCLQVQ